MKIRTRLLALALAMGLCGPAGAQSLGGNASLAATGTSSSVALPVSRSTYPAVIISPAVGVSVDVFYRLGNASVTATIADAALPSGGICVTAGPNTNVAAITGGSAATVRITQLSTCTFFAGGSGGGGGGGGGGTVTQGTVPWVVSNAGTFAAQVTGTVTANAGTNLNTSLLALESGGNLATLAGTVTSSRAAINPISGQAGVQGGAGASTALTQRIAIATDANLVSLAANQSVNVAQINGVTPLMGNGVTGTGSPRVTIASDNTAFSVNATLSAETTKVIGTVRNLGNAGAIFDAATSAAVPANALQVGMAQGGNLIPLSGTSGNLNVQCANCSGSGVSTADEAAFTAGTSLFAGSGGFFQTTATSNALTNGQQGMFQLTANRALFSNLRNAAGTEVGTSTTPLQISVANTGANATAMLVTGTGGTFPITATNLSTNLAQVAGNTAVTGGSNGLLAVAGPAANGAAASGNPLQAGGVYRVTPTTLDDGDVGSFLTDVNGRLQVVGVGLASGATTSGTTGSAVMCATTTAITGGSNGTTNWLNCTPGGAVRMDVSTLAGTAIDTNSGNLSAGTQRVALASNSAAVTTAGMFSVKIDQTTPGTTNLVSLAANQSVNVAQINGVTPLMGNGASGTGAQRVSISNDSTAIAGWGHVATGAAPPSGSTYIGANTSGATGGLVQGLIQCDSTAIYDASTNGSTELVALTAGRTIYVCGYSVLAGGTVNVKLIYGTGTACATGSNNMTPAYQLTAQVGIVDASPFSRGLKTASANALCLNTSAGVAAQAIVYYAKL